MTDIRDYEKLARESGAFRDIELDILVESLQIWRKHPGDPNTLLELRDGKELAGFAVICRASNTEFTYDVLALCIGRSFAGTGAGRGLVDMIEQQTLGESGSAIVRVETSTRKSATLGLSLLPESGYSLIGHISDFYDHGDDYFMYAKHLVGPAAKPEPPAEGDGGDPSPEGGS